MQRVSFHLPVGFVAVLALGVVGLILIGAVLVEGQSSEEHGGNIVFEAIDPKKTVKGHVLMSHEVHLAAGAECNDCHNGTVFSKEKKVGVNKFTMKDVNRGKFCGACHDGVTKAKNGTRIFRPTKNCSRCHNVKWHKSNLR